MNDRMRDETIEQAADRAAAAGDFAGARTMLEHAVEADGSSHGLWMKLSAMRKASGDLKGALAAIDRALAISPLDFPSLLSRAVILDQLGDPSAGEEFGNALPEAGLVAVGQVARIEEIVMRLEFLADLVAQDLRRFE